jgi:hypothetical protein
MVESDLFRLINEKKYTNNEEHGQSKIEFIWCMHRTSQLTLTPSPSLPPTFELSVHF